MKHLKNQRGEAVAMTIFVVMSMFFWGIIGHEQREIGRAEGMQECQKTVVTNVIVEE